MTANINPQSGIAYGYISAHALDPELVNELQSNGTDVHYEEAWNDFVARKQQDHAELQTGDEFDPDEFRDEFNDNYYDDEPVHAGEINVPGYGKVVYRTSWLGGALNVWIFDSPFMTENARRASPCVPNAGILDTLDGDVTSYDVPADWRSE